MSKQFSTRDTLRGRRNTLNSSQLSKLSSLSIMSQEEQKPDEMFPNCTFPANKINIKPIPVLTNFQEKSFPQKPYHKFYSYFVARYENEPYTNVPFDIQNYLANNEIMLFHSILRRKKDGVLFAATVAELYLSKHQQYYSFQNKGVLTLEVTKDTGFMFLRLYNMLTKRCEWELEIGVPFMYTWLRSKPNLFFIESDKIPAMLVLANESDPSNFKEGLDKLIEYQMTFFSKM